MITFGIGVAVGAAFAPFWMKVYAFGKTAYTDFMAKK